MMNKFTSTIGEAAEYGRRLLSKLARHSCSGGKQSSHYIRGPSLEHTVVVSLFAALLTSGCAALNNRNTYYAPESGKPEIPKVSVLEARKSLLSAYQRSNNQASEDLRIIEDGIQFYDKSNPQTPTTYKYAELGSFDIESPLFSFEWVLTIQPVGKRIYFGMDRYADAKLLVDSLYALKYHTSALTLNGDAAAFSEFQVKAEAWRALSQKPPLPEEARRFEVLAKDAIQKREFDKAADYYEKGLEVCPLWPEGQYNAAAIYGELQVYANAISHMKRYLALSPYAKDAQAAKDQMYIWQEKLK